MSELRQKEIKVLECIVKEFIESGKPVGSKLIARKLGDRISSATIRNIMRSLAEQGYLTQPHVSAGRIPTERSFRRYVSDLMRPINLSREDRGHMIAAVADCGGDLSSVLNAISRALSLNTSYIGLARAPELNTLELSQVRFLLLDDKRLLIAMVTRQGKAMTKVVENRENFRATELDRINNYLNENLDGLPLWQVRNKISKEMEKEQILYDTMLCWALTISRNVISEHLDGEVYVEGQSNMLLVPELLETELMFSLFKTCEEKQKLLSLLDRVVDSEGLHIFFSSDLSENRLEGLTFITAPFGGGQTGTGSLGIIGPLRMDYSRIVSLVDFSAGLMQNLISS
jgi:heat-inducible transcriptional repressor